MQSLALNTAPGPIGRYSGDASRFELPKEGDPFPGFVMRKLTALGPLVLNNNRLSVQNLKIAALKFIGEEYATSTGIKGLWDDIQDDNAATGHGGIDTGRRDPATGLPTLGIPESWRRGNFVQKALTQEDFLYHDLGPANINLRAAAILSDTRSPDGLNKLGQYLTTASGTVDFASRFIEAAWRDLEPLIADLNYRALVQIIVDYVREGREVFWGKVEKRRGITANDISSWKQTSRMCQIPEILHFAPAPLAPDPANFIAQQFDQVEGLLR